MLGVRLYGPFMTNLPNPIAAYFAAKNKHDIDGALAPFASDAVVSDERHEHVGATAIRAWMEQTKRDYADTAEPQSASKEGDIIAVSALVSGTFPGSPITLTFRFTLKDDEISALRIG
jgi:hypothetical protein